MATITELRADFAKIPIEQRLKIMCAACCSNPNPTLNEDHNGRPIIVCANCGAYT